VAAPHLMPSGPTCPHCVCLRRHRGLGRGGRTACCSWPSTTNLRSSHITQEPILLSFLRIQGHRLVLHIYASELDRTTSACEWLVAHGGRGRLTTHSVGGSLLHQSPSLSPSPHRLSIGLLLLDKLLIRSLLLCYVSRISLTFLATYLFHCRSGAMYTCLSHLIIYMFYKNQIKVC
jgi:hypothetical protein